MSAPISGNRIKMMKGRFAKYFFREKFRKLLVTMRETTVMIQATQNEEVWVTQITLTKNGRISSSATTFKNLLYFLPGDNAAKCFS